MKSILIISIAIVAFASVGYCQVDTLTAVQIGSINLPDTITQLYAQNLSGDSLKEIVLCTSHNVYVYNAAGDQLLWASPVLGNPGDLQFRDLTGDSIPDITIHTDTALMIFHLQDTTPVFSAEISPTLYKGYTIGDADDDGARDLVLMSQEPFNPEQGQDTAWFSIIYGPDFSQSADYMLMLDNYDRSPDQWVHVYYKETINKIILTRVGSGIYSQPLIYLNTSTEHIWHDTSPDDSYLTTEHSGRYYMIDPVEFEFLAAFARGQADTLGVYNSGNNHIVFSTSNYTYTSEGLTTDGSIIKKRMLKFTTWGLFDSTEIFSYVSNRQELSCGWFACFGEMNGGHPGPEYCYGYANSLFQSSLMYNTQIWSTAQPGDSTEVLSVFNSGNLFSSPEIVLKCIQPRQGYLFLNGETHSVDAILPDTSHNISLVGDIDGNGADEILSKNGNSLYIYTLAPVTGTDNDIVNPDKFALIGNYPNPFNAQTTIKYNLPAQSNIELEIYDILGRKMEVIEKAKQPAGANQVAWDASGQPTGVYFYRLTAGNEQKAGRMILLK